MAEVITSDSRSREVVADLMKYDVISVDAEGINLGKDGPLTLLQIGTKDKKVYLFDVWTNKKLFGDGMLKKILESPNVVKVIHSCKGDSAALYFQFGVHLNNVFDTQVAHLVIEEHKGKKLPRSIKLSEICTKYSENAAVSEEKDTIKESFLTEVGDLWARRPLTKEMISYASGDVTAIVPDVYETQKTYLSQQNLLSKFRDRIHEEIDFFIDPTMKKQREQRQDEAMKKILSLIPSKYHSTIKYQDIIDEDDIRAIDLLHHETPDLHPLVSRLKAEAMKAQLEELDAQLSKEGDNFVPKSRSYGFLRSYQNHLDDQIKQNATRIFARINTIALNNITRKYSTTTTLGMISSFERDALKTLRPKGDSDPNVNRVQLHLYWLLKESDLDATIKEFAEKGRLYTVSEGYYKWFKFCCSGKVPQSIKDKAKSHLRNMDQTFGRGVVPKSAR